MTPRLSAAAQRAHDAAEARGQDGYLDPDTGLFVMTAGYLRRRGTCCRSGCRHCPYGFHDEAGAPAEPPRKTP